MNKVYLLIGGNLGDRFLLLSQAKERICAQIGSCIKESAVYESEPWGFETNQDFLNQVLIVTTELTAIDVLNKCQEIEKELGRKRKANGYSSRTMDVDILFVDDEIINTERLTVPHACLHERRFTLEPLVELTPEFIHPVMKKSLKELLMKCSDKSEIRKL